MTEKKIDANWLIGDVLKDFPETLPVFRKYFGEGCFTCPGARLETIAFGATMHGLDVDTIVRELNECLTATKVE
jgi:hybrid cluster-associated redox disulfide protein